VEERERASGVLISLLYSDIDPAYYGKLGYQTCASWEGWIDPREIPVEPAGDVGRLVPLLPENEWDHLSKLYDGCHTARPIAIARDQNYWEYLQEKEPTDFFYWLEGSSGERLGYVRLDERDEKFVLRDWAIADQTESAHRVLFQTLLQAAQQQHVAQFGGWLPDLPAVRELFELKPRAKEITMLKALDLNSSLQADLLRESQHFQEIDHV